MNVIDWSATNFPRGSAEARMLDGISLLLVASANAQRDPRAGTDSRSDQALNSFSEGLLNLDYS